MAEEKKSTWRSTTFILVVVSQLLTLVSAIAQYLDPKTAAITLSCLTAIFAGCNAWIKVNAPVVEDVANKVSVAVEPPKP
jgi:hypothetical protein